MIIGTVLIQLGAVLGLEVLGVAGQVGVLVMGPAIGASLAYERNAGAFATVGAVVAGGLGAGNLALGGIGEPVGALLSSLAAVEVGRFIENRTRFDILLVPTASILAGALVSQTAAPHISAALLGIGIFINDITQLQPLIMGILVGAVMGMLLTTPISSTAIAVSIGLEGIAAGAALAGGAAQMVGFAVSSFPENRISGLITQGLGTSMLQFPNIINNPLIWLAPTLSGAVGGGLSASVFEIQTSSIAAGIGNAGLVGQVITHATMGDSAILPMVLLHFVIPAILSLGLTHALRVCGLVRHGDMQL